MTQPHFGEHLTIDGYGGNPDKLNDGDLVLSILNELPDKLGMHKLSEPQIMSAPDTGNKDPGGWSGFVIIAESHISIHTFPKRKFVSADIYTCVSGMDTAFILDYFKNHFDLQEIEENFVIRGKKYPQQNIL